MDLSLTMMMTINTCVRSLVFRLNVSDYQTIGVLLETMSEF